MPVCIGHSTKGLKEPSISAPSTSISTTSSGSITA
jgi:hypothetical protein